MLLLTPHGMVAATHRRTMNHVVTDNGKVILQGRDDAVGDAPAESVIITAKIRAGGRDDQDARDCLAAIEIGVDGKAAKRTIKARWSEALACGH